MTSISIDHTEFLGSTIESISAHKAGIIKEGVKAVVVAPQKHPQSIPIFQKAAKFPVYLVVVDEHVGRGYQKENIATALKVLSVLNDLQLGYNIVPDVEKLLDLKFPGRLDTIRYKSKEILVDGCHNEAGALAFSSYIKSINTGPICYIFAASSTKKVESILRIIVSLDDILIPVLFDTPQGMAWVKPKPISDITKTCSELGVHTIDVNGNLNDALDKAIELDRKVVICGSLYLVSSVYRLLN
jgi:folylpolyglutamate synthase/dihydropteroate synthase